MAAAAAAASRRSTRSSGNNNGSKSCSVWDLGNRLDTCKDGLPPLDAVTEEAEAQQYVGRHALLAIKSPVASSKAKRKAGKATPRFKKSYVLFAVCLFWFFYHLFFCFCLFCYFFLFV
jgi:hypothetical protein